MISFDMKMFGETALINRWKKVDFGGWIFLK